MNKVDTKTTEYVIDVYYTTPPYNFTIEEGGRINVTGKYSFPIKNITDGIKEPFDPDNLTELKTFIQKIESFNFKINNLFTSSQALSSQTLCFNWTLTISYEFVATSHIEAGLDAQYTYCSADYDGFKDEKQKDKEQEKEKEGEKENEKENNKGEDKKEEQEIEKVPDQKEEPEKEIKPESKLKSVTRLNKEEEAKEDVIPTPGDKYRSHAPFGNTLSIIHLFVLIFAFASFISGWHYVYEIGLLQMASKHAKHMTSPIFSYNQEEEDDEKKTIETNWNNLSFIEKMKFFDVFFYVMMIGNVFQIFGSIVAIYQILVQTNTNILLGIRQSCIGFGAMCTWFCLIKYFSESKQFKTTTNLLAESTVRVLKFCVGIMPLFLAFVFMGRCLFWKYEKFETTQHSFVALFAIVAGDILDETYTDIAAEGFLSVIFITFWIVLFMSSVHNVFISIISNGFKNKFLEDRYQELFDQYSLGDRDAVSKWNVNQKEVMAENFSKTEEKKEDLMEWIPYVRRGDENVDFEVRSREKIKRLEIEKNNMRADIFEKSEELEQILADMKEITDEFCSVSKDPNEKAVVKNSLAKCLKDLHLYIRTELTYSPLREKQSIDITHGEEVETSRMTESEVTYRGPKTE